MEVRRSDAAAKHLARSQRYSGAADIELAWTVEAVNDIDAVQVDPYWTSRVNALAIIGYSPAAGAVLLVLAYRDLDDDLHGMSACQPPAARCGSTPKGESHDQATRLKAGPRAAGRGGSC